MGYGELGGRGLGVGSGRRLAYGGLVVIGEGSFDEWCWGRWVGVAVRVGGIVSSRPVVGVGVRWGEQRSLALRKCGGLDDGSGWWGVVKGTACEW